MKKVVKRVLSAVLVVCLGIALFPAMATKADAATVTYEEMLARAEAIVNYTWTPSTRIYTWNGNKYNGKKYFEAGETVKGMPYTLFYNEFGVDSLLSLSQYRSVATLNYSAEAYCISVKADRTGPVYGSCCATFVSEVFGGNFMSGSNPRYDNVTGIKDSAYGTTYYNVTVESIQPGDALSNTKGNHIIWIGEVTDSSITIYEQTPPVAKKTVVSKTSVNTSGYLVHEGSVYSTLTRSNDLANSTSQPVIPSNQHTKDSTYNAFLPIKAYPVATENIGVYNESGSLYSNRYITGSTDLCTINAIYTDGWCQVTYPSSAEPSGYFTAYVLLSEFIPNVSLSSWTAGGNATAYRRSTGSDTIGSVSSGDSGLQVGSANGRIQVIYPVTGQGYYKMGWITEGNSSSGSENPGTMATSYLLPCYSYPISIGNISVYDSSHNKYSNRYITGSTDKCIIREIYTDGWCYVSYPSSAESDGWFEAYVPLSEFISNANPAAWTATGNYTAYCRSSGTDTIGSITSGDSCVVVSEANGRMQVMYPVTGQNYYKMGWIDASLANNPQGVVDSVSGGIYSVSVRGWAFDKDDMNASLDIHVYIGGVCHVITANTERPDVNSAYGCGNYHGFDATITVDKSLAGSKTVEVYAINVGSGTNILLGSSTVAIGSDTTAPAITNVSVTDISSSGYTVTCTVTDANGIDRVQFPTWTTNNGQDDLFADWNVNSAASGTKNGDTYTYRVYTSAHNYEGGEYTTHIYAFDRHGNQTQYSVPLVQVPVDVVSVDLDSSELNIDILGDSKQLTAYVYPDNATDQTLTWATSDASVAVVENGLVTAVGYGTATITATANNGVYAACVVTVAEAMLEKIEIATEPSKTVYEIGELLDTSGLTLTATYSNGTTQTITGGYTVSGFDSATAGSKTVTVTYAGKSTTFVVTVNEIMAESDPQIVVESKAATPGETITVTISVRNNPGIASLKLKVAYENVLTLTSVDYNSSIGGQYMQPSKMNSPVTLNWFNGLANSEGDWTFVTLTFVVSEDVEPDTSTSITVTYDADDVYDITENNVHFAVENGTIEIVDYTPGDVNGDGAVNNKDLTRLFKYLSNYDVEVVEAALDINGDGAVNNKDLTRLFQYLSNYNVEIF